jgi:hypothetical protein
MTESAAIPHYLATRYGPTPLAVDVGEPDYGLWLDWLQRSEATLTFPQTIVLRYTRLEPEERRAKQAADDYAQWFLSRLRHLTRALADREWLCAGRFTMADLCVGYALLFAKTLELDHKFSPEIAAYWERLAARPAFQAAKANVRSSSSRHGRFGPGLGVACPALADGDRLRLRRWPICRSSRTAAWAAGHVQGVAVDVRGGYIYYSFTNLLAKYDFSGKLIGTLVGWTGHLGDLDFNPADGKVYGSLEYKEDKAFYIAVIDVARLDRVGVEASKTEIFRTVYLPEVVKDYAPT